ncbi:MAG: hypothetical protein QOE61_3524 [Micromonosporaceae bacterium]|nr:hypothetical protein [Micromonosporaceae bacterium]
MEGYETGVTLRKPYVWQLPIGMAPVYQPSKLVQQY